VYRRTPALIAAIALLAIAFGCGGDDGGDETVSRAEYVQRANAICAKAEKQKNAAIEAEFARLGEEVQRLGQEAELQMVRTVALPPISRMVEQLAALPNPDADAAEAEAIVAAYEAAVEEVADEPVSVLSDPTPFTPADGLAEDFGLEACAGT